MASLGETDHNSLPSCSLHRTNHVTRSFTRSAKRLRKSCWHEAWMQKYTQMPNLWAGRPCTGGSLLGVLTHDSSAKVASTKDHKLLSHGHCHPVLPYWVLHDLNDHEPFLRGIEFRNQHNTSVHRTNHRACTLCNPLCCPLPGWKALLCLSKPICCLIEIQKLCKKHSSWSWQESRGVAGWPQLEQRAAFFSPRLLVARRCLACQDNADGDFT